MRDQRDAMPAAQRCAASVTVWPLSRTRNRIARGALAEALPPGVIRAPHPHGWKVASMVDRYAGPRAQDVVGSYGVLGTHMDR